jgi:3-oxoacyl-[acyl-carrier protein] reductase
MIHTMPDETYDIIMKIHVRAPFRLIRAAAPYFRVKVRSSALNPVIFEQ